MPPAYLDVDGLFEPVRWDPLLRAGEQGSLAVACKPLDVCFLSTASLVRKDALLRATSPLRVRLFPACQGYG